MKREIKIEININLNSCEKKAKKNKAFQNTFCRSISVSSWPSFGMFVVITEKFTEGTGAFVFEYCIFDFGEKEDSKIS